MSSITIIGEAFTELLPDPTVRMNPDERHYAIAAGASGGGGDGRDVPVIATPRRLTAALIVEIELTD